MAIQNRVYNGFYNPNRSDLLITWLHKLHVSERVDLSPKDWETSTPHFFQTQKTVESLGKFLLVIGALITISTTISLVERYFFYIPPDFYTSSVLSILGGISLGGIILFFTGLIILKKLPSMTFWHDPAFCQQQREAELENLLFIAEQTVPPPKTPSAYNFVSLAEMRKVHKDLKGHTWPRAIFNQSGEDFCHHELHSYATFSDFFDHFGWTFLDKMLHPDLQKILREHFGPSLLNDFETLGFEKCIEKYRDVYFDFTPAGIDYFPENRVRDLLNLIPNSNSAQHRIKNVFLNFLKTSSFFTCFDYFVLGIVDSYKLCPEHVKNSCAELVEIYCEARYDIINRSPTVGKNSIIKSALDALHEGIEATWRYKKEVEFGWREFEFGWQG